MSDFFKGALIVGGIAGAVAICVCCPGVGQAALSLAAFISENEDPWSLAR